MKGRDLVGLEYEPLYPYSVPTEGRAHYVVDADFVSTDEGTGVVHTSALYGVDDLSSARRRASRSGTRWASMESSCPTSRSSPAFTSRRPTRSSSTTSSERGLLYKSETILHTYPFCWRCSTALIYYALDSWYVRTTERKDELIANNAATNWVPAHIKTGPHGRLAREQRRLGHLALSLLGHAASVLGLREMRRAEMRRARRPSSASKRTWTCTGRSSTPSPCRARSAAE